MINNDHIQLFHSSLTHSGSSKTPNYKIHYKCSYLSINCSNCAGIIINRIFFCISRWGSFIHCVESIVKNKHGLQALAINDEAKDVLDSSIKKTILSEVFWEHASGYVNVLKPVADAILKLEGDDTCLSQVLQVMSDISRAININVESPFLMSEKESLKKIIIERRKFLVKKVHLAADLLDPKYNGCHLSGEERVSTG